MSNVRRAKARFPEGARVRAFRTGAGLTLDDLADQLKRAGSKRRPSTAKLSRIENGLQPVPTDILAPLAKITSIPAGILRPDLAAMFAQQSAAA
ncbi:MAG: helix-turn-helix domain-containing protein [Alphaproteobacteria bacterium]|nr:MAG: helix-turn-helix domain-containing protein [Alphaproteobacteria bacterium]